MGLEKVGSNTVEFRKILQICSTFGVTVWVCNMGHDVKDAGRTGLDKSEIGMDDLREGRNIEYGCRGVDSP